MKVHIPDFSTSQVLVIGDLMLDRYWHGDTSRISPEAPVPVVHVGETEERPGGAGNVALNIAGLGAHATVMGLTGQDEAATALGKNLEASGVSCQFDKLENVPTITKLRVMSRHQQLIRLDFEDGFTKENAQGLLEHYLKLLPQARVVILSDYGKGTLGDAEALIAAARSAGTRVLVDPKGSDFSHYRGASLITPNLSEFEAVVGKCSSDEELVSKGEALRQELEIEALLVTRSEKGMTLLRADHDPLHLPTRAREVFDVTGAGDTVISVLAAALGAGEDMANATALANLAAGVVVGKMGTATVSVQELSHTMRELEELERGVVSEDKLVALIHDAQTHGERIVMTNGCFDILHAGHVQYLEQAAELGDRLIVAVNDDDSVRRLKGDERPINPVEQRMAVMAGLESVDWVVPFSEDTPERIICRLVPNVLVKGGDYQPHEIAGGDCVTEAGGEIVIIDFLEGCSTTRIVKTIRQGSTSK